MFPQISHIHAYMGTTELFFFFLRTIARERGQVGFRIPRLGRKEEERLSWLRRVQDRESEAPCKRAGELRPEGCSSGAGTAEMEHRN